MHILDFHGVGKKFILVLANRLGHKIKEIGGTVTNPVFFSKTRWSTYILTFIFLTVQDDSLQRYMVCLSEFFVKSAMTKYAMKNYIGKSVVVSGLIKRYILRTMVFNVSGSSLWNNKKSVTRTLFRYSNASLKHIYFKNIIVR